MREIYLCCERERKREKSEFFFSERKQENGVYGYLDKKKKPLGCKWRCSEANGKERLFSFSLCLSILHGFFKSHQSIYLFNMSTYYLGNEILGQYLFLLFYLFVLKTKPKLLLFWHFKEIALYCL